MSDKWEYKLLYAPLLQRSIRSIYPAPKDAPKAYRGEPILVATPPSTPTKR